jgi:Ca2+-binding RTX toxin-like protein
MAVYKITSTESFHASGPNIDTFDEDSPTADSLIVDAGAFLIARGVNGDGAVLGNLGAWTVNVNGWIASDSGYGIALGNTEAKSKITIGAEGSVSSNDGDALYALSSVAITNNGTIRGGNYGVFIGWVGDYSVTNSGVIVGNNGTAIISTATGNDTVTNAGTIQGAVNLGDAAGALADGNDTVTNTKGTIAGGVLLGHGNNKLTNSGLIEGSVISGKNNDTFGNTGTIGGLISLGNGANKLTNSGLIDGSVTGGFEKDTVVNSGTIDGGVFLSGDVNSLTNSGKIFGVITAGADVDTVTNSGTITGDGVNHTIDLDSGDSKFTNSGTVTGLVVGKNAYQGSSGKDTFTNSGVIDGAVDLSSGENVFTNSGTITKSVSFSAGNDTFTNSGKIVGAVTLSSGENIAKNSGKGDIGSITAGAGHDTLTNAAKIGTVDLSSGNNIVTNSGTISDLTLGSGNDKVTNTGSIGIVVLGAGDDTYNGSSKIDVVFDGAGGDNIKLGAGDDFYVGLGGGGIATDKTDVIDGGVGIDTYEAQGTSNNIFVNLDTVDHNEFGFAAIWKSRASGADVNFDMITGFENVETGDGNDTIYGSAAANVISGGDGDDKIAGYAGNDTIKGENNDDVIVGGLGADQLYGGTGNDDFVYTSIKDSGVTKTTRDVIRDFTAGDQIDLSAIDANTKLDGNQAFDYLNDNVGGGNSQNNAGVLFNKVAGELRTVWNADGYMLEGDVNGDGKADFSIQIYNPAHTLAMTSADFIL